MKKPNKFTKPIPNLITSLNILSGCVAIVMAFNGELVISAYLIGLAAIFDFLDGMAARLLGAYSEIGKQLDSLADMISFGFAPSAIMFQLIMNGIKTDSALATNEYLVVLPYVAFLIAILSAFRLAKFNIDTRQTDSFIGLATPANAIFIASLPVVLEFSDIIQINNIIENPWFLLITTVVFSILLVSEFPMFSLKIKNLRFADNKMRFIFLILSLILIISLRHLAIPCIIIVYIILSAINNWILKN